MYIRGKNRCFKYSEYFRLEFDRDTVCPCWRSTGSAHLVELYSRIVERDHWGDLGVDGWIILGWIFRRWDVSIWTGLGWPRIETGGGRL